MTSLAAMGTFFLIILSALLTRQHSTPVSAPQNGTEVEWNPCSMWVNYGPMHGLTGLVALGTSLLFAARGLRGRSGPRWLALAGLLSLVLAIEGMWWQIGCGGPVRAVLIGTWYCSLAISLLYHAVYHSQRSADWPPGHTTVAIFYRAVVFGFMALLVFWLGLFQLALVAPAQKRQFAAEIIGRVQASVALPAYLLLSGALALGAYRRVAWSRSSPQERA